MRKRAHKGIQYIPNGVIPTERKDSPIRVIHKHATPKSVLGVRISDIGRVAIAKHIQLP